MQLDKTLIVVRERSIFDTLDLALRVLRIYAWPLWVMMFLGAIGWAVANLALTGWMLSVDLDAPDSPEAIGGIIRYLWTVALLVYLEAPLASAFATVYLGQALFVERPRWRDCVRDVLLFSPRLIWCHVVLRGILVAMLLVVSIDRSSSFSGAEVLLLLLVMGVSVRRVTAPLLNEIILLERNPLRSTRGHASTVGRRSSMLHGPASGNLITLGFTLGIFALPLVVVLVATFWALVALFAQDLEVIPLVLHVGYPLALWLTATYLTVVRFLSYLDLRIRFEGWEVELRLRAEANRLAGARS